MHWHAFVSADLYRMANKPEGKGYSPLVYSRVTPLKSMIPEPLFEILVHIFAPITSGHQPRLNTIPINAAKAI